MGKLRGIRSCLITLLVGCAIVIGFFYLVLLPFAHWFDEDNCRLVCVEEWGEKSCREKPGSADSHVPRLANPEADRDFRICMDRLHNN